MARGTSDDAAPHVRLHRHSAPQATSLCESPTSTGAAGGGVESVARAAVGKVKELASRTYKSGCVVWF